MALTEVIQTSHSICQLASNGACTFRMMLLHKRPFSTVHAILLVKTSALLTAYILLHKNTCLELMFSITLPQKSYARPVLIFYHRTTLNLTKFTIYLCICLQWP